MIQDTMRAITADEVYKKIRSALAGYIKANGAMGRGRSIDVHIKNDTYMKYLPTGNTDIIVDIPATGAQKRSWQYCFRLADCDIEKRIAKFTARKVDRV
ncbi:hypothetical protein L6270_01935 [Candidatus Parcubacteria bacterium]|nr:hypothetical protein [Patescibacteria group bacterium]MBU4309894.1 hypothetical protein [Patescibacteria group bacterium]MBU4431902.1 hypothetical protein [Patescibacteria group bacterium]MBU4578233.1 hypothetical protein [Patescibacteria group bacterium]MCG2696769.1 hypothetical protein [Candidatus Parcubacteria bacterium]